MDVCVQELPVYCPVANRRRCHGKLYFCQDECDLLSARTALSLLRGMAIQACHDFACFTLVFRSWYVPCVFVLTEINNERWEVTGIGSPYAASQTSQNDVFGGNVARWIKSFYATTFATNVLATCAYSHLSTLLN